MEIFVAVVFLVLWLVERHFYSPAADGVSNILLLAAAGVLLIRVLRLKGFFIRSEESEEDSLN